MLKKLTRLADRLSLLFRTHEAVLQVASDAELRAIEAGVRSVTPDNPALRGYRVYSQFDEDGIIDEIFRRIGPGARTFLEIGCGDGRENNTHLLLLKGWRGTWVDGDARHIEAIRHATPASERLRLLQRFVDRDNVAELAEPVDFLSLDIDGNDVHVLKAYLTHSQPRVICVEYNAQFPPPLDLAIAYDPEHRWAYNDYYGGSLQAFINAMPGYQLVACSLNGNNAFFVNGREAAKSFEPYPAGALYQPPRYHLTRARHAHPASLRFLANALREHPNPAAGKAHSAGLAHD